MSPNRQQVLTLHPRLIPHVPDALLRFSYLHPNVDVAFDGESLRIEGSHENDVDLVRELTFCVYREKIFAQTLPLRQMLIEGVTGRDYRSA